MQFTKGTCIYPHFVSGGKRLSNHEYVCVCVSVCTSMWEYYEDVGWGWVSTCFRVCVTVCLRVCGPERSDEEGGGGEDE